MFDLFRPSVEKLEARGDVEGLIKTLYYKKDLKVRWEAVKALSRIGEPSVEAFVQALKDESELIRREAAVALGEIKDEKAIEPLITALTTDEESEVRGSAAFALGSIGSEKAIEPLITALTTDEESGVRGSAADALGSIGDNRAVEPLKKALKDEGEFAGEKVKDKSFTSLEKINHRIHKRIPGATLKFTMNKNK